MFAAFFIAVGGSASGAKRTVPRSRRLRHTICLNFDVGDHPPAFDCVLLAESAWRTWTFRRRRRKADRLHNALFYICVGRKLGHSGSPLLVSRTCATNQMKRTFLEAAVRPSRSARRIAVTSSDVTLHVCRGAPPVMIATPAVMRDCQIRPLWLAISPRGWQSHPSAPEIDNHRARVRVP